MSSFRKFSRIGLPGEHAYEQIPVEERKLLSAADGSKYRRTQGSKVATAMWTIFILVGIVAALIVGGIALNRSLSGVIGTISNLTFVNFYASGNGKIDGTLEVGGGISSKKRVGPPPFVAIVRGSEDVAGNLRVNGSISTTNLTVTDTATINKLVVSMNVTTLTALSATIQNLISSTISATSAVFTGAISAASGLFGTATVTNLTVTGTFRDGSGSLNQMSLIELHERVCMVANHLDMWGYSQLYLLVLKSKVSLAEYNARRLAFMKKYYLNPPVPFESDVLFYKDKYYQELANIDKELIRRREFETVLNTINDIDQIRYAINKLLLFKSSPSAYYQGVIFSPEIYNIDYETWLNPIMGYSTLIENALNPLTADFVPFLNLFDKPHATYTTEEYRIVLEMMKQITDRVIYSQIHMDLGMRTGYRALAVDYDRNLGLGAIPFSYNIPWNTSAYFALAPTTPEQTILKDQIRSQYEIYRTAKQSFYDRFNFFYRNITASTSPTLSSLYPLTFANTSKANEPIVRSRYAVASAFPNGPYADIAGVIPKWPTVELAADDYARGFAGMIDERTNPFAAAQRLKSIYDAFETGPETAARVPFVQQYTSLKRNSDGQVLNISNFKFENRDQLRQGWSFHDSAASVTSIDNATNLVTTIDPHMLKVGDSVYLMDRRVGHRYSMLPPLSYNGSAFIFDFDPQLLIGDQFTMRDYGVTLNIVRRRSLTATQLHTPGTGRYYNNLRNESSCVILPENSTFTYMRFVQRTVSAVSNNGTNWYVSFTGPALTAATYSRQLVFLYKVVTPFKVIAVPNGNQFQLNMSVADAGLLTNLSRVEVRVDLDTMERITCSVLTSYFNRIALGLGSIFSDKMLSRFNNATFLLYRTQGIGQSAGSGVFNWGVTQYRSAAVQYSSNVLIHEIMGHVFYFRNAAVADFSSVSLIQASLGFPQTLVEGQADYMETSVIYLQKALVYYPERRVTRISDTNRIYYSAPPNEVDTSLMPGDEVFVFSFSPSEQTSVVSTALLASYDGGKHSVVYKIASKGVDGTHGPYVVVTNVNGSAVSFGVLSGPLTSTYIVNSLYAKNINCQPWEAENEAYTIGIAYGDIAVNYLHRSPLEIEACCQSSGATDERNTAHPLQHITYGYGSLIIEQYVNSYCAQIGITVNQFYRNGHVKGFWDAMMLDGRLDQKTKERRVQAFIDYVKAGGNFTRYYVGQEATPGKRSHEMTESGEPCAISREELVEMTTKEGIRPPHPGDEVE